MKKENKDAQHQEPLLYATANTKGYQAVRRQLTIGTGGFTVGMDELFPSVQLESKNKYIGTIQVKPRMEQFEIYRLKKDEMEVMKKAMQRFVSEINDLTVDMLDISMMHWLQNAKTDDDFVVMNVDDILEYRGIQKKVTADKYTSGYRSEQRELITRHLQILSHLQIAINVVKYNKKGEQTTHETLSPILLIDWINHEKNDANETEKTMISVQPGRFLREALKAHRQTALMPQPVLAYDFDKYAYEKRLGRYLTSIWRNRRKNSNYLDAIKIQTLLDEIGITEKRPHRIKARFERLLDRLEADQVIATWQYADDVEHLVGKRGWITQFVQSKIAIEPPMAITQHYNTKIKSVTKKTKKTLVSADIVKQLQEKRKQQGLSLHQLAEILGVSASSLSKWESGKRNPRGNTLKTIGKWLNRK